MPCFPALSFEPTLNNITSDVSVQYVFSSLGESEGEEPPWRVSLLIVNGVVSFKIDTGADMSVISEPQWKSICPRLKPHAKTGC